MPDFTHMHLQVSAVNKEDMSAIGFCFEQLGAFTQLLFVNTENCQEGNRSSSTFRRGHCSKQEKKTTTKNTRNWKDLIINLCLKKQSKLLQYSSACFRLQMTEHMAHHSFLKILTLIWGQQRGWKASSSCSTHCQIISAVCQLYAASLILNAGGIMFLVQGWTDEKRLPLPKSHPRIVPFTGELRI